MTFSASDAAFEGFRVVRRKPIVLVWWALAYLVVFGLTFLLTGGSVFGMTAAAERLEAMGPNADPTAVFQTMAPMVGVFVVLLPLSLLANAVFQAAVVRSVITPGAGRFGYMRVGGDELRLIIVMIALFALLLLAYLVLAVVVGIAAGVAGATGSGVAIIVAVVLGLAAFCALIWAAVRLSLAGPITVAEKRIAIFDSFALTKGRFWSLLGMVVIIVVMSLLIGMLSWAVMLPVTLLTGGMAHLAALEGEGLQTILATAAPAVIAWVMVNSLMSALMLAVAYAPFSAAYLALKGRAAG